MSKIVVGNPPQVLKSDVPKPVPVIIEITLKEANLKASIYGILFNWLCIELS